MYKYLIINNNELDETKNLIKWSKNKIRIIFNKPFDQYEIKDLIFLYIYLKCFFYDLENEISDVFFIEKGIHNKIVKTKIDIDVQQEIWFKLFNFDRFLQIFTFLNKTSSSLKTLNIKSGENPDVNKIGIEIKLRYEVTIPVYPSQEAINFFQKEFN